MKKNLIILLCIITFCSCKQRSAESVSEITSEEVVCPEIEETEMEEVEMVYSPQFKSAVSGDRYERKKITITEGDQWILGRWVGYVEGKKIVLGFEEDRYILNDEYEGSFIIDYYATWDNLTCRGDRSYSLSIDRKNQKLKLNENGEKYILDKASTIATDKDNDSEIKGKHELLGEWIHSIPQEEGEKIDHTLILKDNGSAEYRQCSNGCEYNGEYIVRDNCVYFKGDDQYKQRINRKFNHYYPTKI